MTRLLALAALALLLPACDSGGSPAPTDSNDLIGTWRTQREFGDRYATLSQTQSVRDSYAAGEGGIVLSGAAAVTLRYAPIRTRGTSVVGGRVDPAGEVNTVRDVPYIQFDAGGTPSVEIRASSGADRTFVLEWRATPAYTVTPAAIEFTSAVFREAAGGATITASGRLAFVRRALQAGQEGLVTRFPFAPADAGTSSISFAADGTYRIVSPFRPVESGTWVAVADGQVQLRGPDLQRSLYDYTIQDGILSVTGAFQAFDAESLPRFEELCGVVTGTITAARSRSGTSYQRSAAPGRAAGE